MIRLLIIDDEPSARDALRTLLAAHRGLEIVGEAATLTEARFQLARSDYDAVFLDIQLRGGSGFDLVPHVRPGARVIFVTAHDEHALRAFTVNALDYLLKPVDPARLADALSRLPAAGTPPPAAPDSPSVPALRLDDRVLVKLGAGHERFIRLADIRMIGSSENYSELLVGPGGERLFVRKSMKTWEEVLPAAHFVRVHRQTIVGVTHVRAIERVSESTLHLRIDGLAQPVQASYRYLADLRRTLGLR